MPGTSNIFLTTLWLITAAAVSVFSFHVDEVIKPNKSPQNDAPITTATPTPQIETEKPFVYKDQACEKHESLNGFTVYNCYKTVDPASSYIEYETIVKKPDGSVLSLPSYLQEQTSTNFSLYASAQVMHSKLLLIETFTGGAHCCHEYFVFDTAASKFTARINTASVPMLPEKVKTSENYWVFDLDHPGFEYFGGSYATHVSPPIKVKIKNDGYIEVGSIETTVEQQKLNHIKALLELNQNEMINDKAALCDTYNDEYTVCLLASQETKILAAETASLILAGKETDAMEFFYGFAEQNELNASLFDEIKDKALGTEFIKNF